jgi:hypothetical protein
VSVAALIAGGGAAIKKVSLAFPGSLLVMMITIAISYPLDLEHVRTCFPFVSSSIDWILISSPYLLCSTAWTW